MKKKIVFFTLIVLALSVSFILPATTLAQMALPAGGDSFETAVPLFSGEYQGRVFEEDEDSYYSISDIRPGQEIQVQVLFSGNTNISLLLYQQDKQKLAGEEYIGENENYLLRWLNGASTSQKYYLQVTNQTGNSATLKSTNVKLIDRFDAGSQTDAGGSFESSLPVEAGKYQGFLAAEEGGDDEKDFYQINIKRGQNLTVKATPPTDVSLELTIYDQNRNELFGDYSQNEGAIIFGSVKAVKDGTFYIAVVAVESYYDRETIKYDLDISGDTLDQSQSGMVNPPEEETTDEPTEALAKIGPAISGSSKNLKFIFLIMATVLTIIVVTIVFLIKDKSDKKEAPEEKFVYCSKCGAKNPARAQFCFKCGEKLT